MRCKVQDKAKIIRNLCGQQCWQAYGPMVKVSLTKKRDKRKKKKEKALVDSSRDTTDWQT